MVARRPSGPRETTYGGQVEATREAESPQVPGLAFRYHARTPRPALITTDGRSGYVLPAHAIVQLHGLGPGRRASPGEVPPTRRQGREHHRPSRHDHHR